MFHRFVSAALAGLALSGLAAISAPSAQAQILYTVREGDNVLRRIDPNTLVFTDIGPLGVSFEFGGLGYASATQTLYMIGGRGNNALYTVNTATGAATLVGAHGINDMFGLEFDNSTGRLFASAFNGQLYELNTSTGAATLIGNTGVGNLGGLAYNSATGQFMGVSDGAGDLYNINRTTAASALVFNGSNNNNSGLAYDTALNRLWDIDWTGVLRYYDGNAGFAETIALTGLGSHDGLAYVPSGVPPLAAPEPATLALIGTVLLPVLGAVIRRKCSRP